VIGVAVIPEREGAVSPAPTFCVAAGASSAAAPHQPKVYGELLAELPHDLYIPPDALEIILDSFEGPLDLLLYLIRRANINILDIPMAPLTTQYLRYVEAMRSWNLELAAEYLLMAAMLIEIKSRLLLPRPPRTEEGEPEDPRAELVRRLVEYERMKAAAARLDELPQAGRDVEWITVWIADKVAQRQPEVSIHDLQAAWLTLLKQARVHQHHRIQRLRAAVRPDAGHGRAGGQFSGRPGAGARVFARNYTERCPCPYLCETIRFRRCCRCTPLKISSASSRRRCWLRLNRCRWPS
jgi:segregation and condensation protein A